MSNTEIVKEITEAFLPFCEVIREYPKAVNVLSDEGKYILVIDSVVLNGGEPSELNHKIVYTDNG